MVIKVYTCFSFNPFFSGSVMEGHAVFEYTVYIYTSGNDSDSASLNVTVKNIISVAIEEKLQVTVTTINMIGMNVYLVNYFLDLSHYLSPPPLSISLSLSLYIYIYIYINIAFK